MSAGGGTDGTQVRREKFDLQRRNALVSQIEGEKRKENLPNDFVDQDLPRLDHLHCLLAQTFGPRTTPSEYKEQVDGEQSLLQRVLRGEDECERETLRALADII
ncbi:hypothetical protein H0H81_010437 [Sphagnurus paluster]|uniref:Uncharacterized protein n=1 Tax=Sphagnurus paluster TaxID=117069 RepID=A0A9P7GKI2_9AGAR|nr:hypothetical protein H0H81_010437 [Sphagnurus paluster]